MNRTDRAKLERIRKALSSVPFAHDGSGAKSASVRGFVTFQRDMRVVKGACEDALFLLVSPDPDKEPKDQDREFDDAIQVAEGWIEKRILENWI